MKHDRENLNGGAEKGRGVSRRNFLTGGVAVGAAALATAALSGCNAKERADAPRPSDEELHPIEGASLLKSDSDQNVYPLGVPDTDETAPLPPVTPPSQWTEEADFVVVGSGAGGLACADYLQQHGLHVVLVEKHTRTGGASRFAGGVANPFGGATNQNVYGIAWPKYPSSLKDFTSAYEADHQWTVDQGIIKRMAYASGPAIDWTLSHKGLDWIPSPSGYADADIMSGKQTSLMGMNNTIEAFDKDFQDKGGHEYLGARVDALVMDGGKVVGVRAQSDDKGTIYIKGEKGVALCTGGIGMNRALIKKYLPSAYQGTAQGGPMPGNEGDGFRLGLGAGADIAGYDSWSAWESGIDEETNGGDGSFWHYFWHGERQVFHNPWLLINKNGERVHYYSNGVQGFNYEPSIQMGDMQNCSCWAAQPGGRVYNICDSRFADYVFKFKQSSFFVDSSRIPITPDKHLLSDSLCSNNWKDDFEDAVKRGAVKKADTLDELAEMLTLDPDVLKKAVNNYNRICKQGKDDELIPPYDPSWLHEVSKPPFYGVIMGVQMSKTGCGLRVNDKLEVVDVDKKPIAGLYANCWTAGGFIGEANHGGFWNGAMNGGVGTSLISGFCVAQTILGEENPDPSIVQRKKFAHPKKLPIPSSLD